MTSALMPTYARADLAFDRGNGCWLTSIDGDDYLDFGAGIATSSLGHNHPALVQAIQSQAARIIHSSNLYRVPQAEALAARLVAASFADGVFFANSGTEANEGLVKLMRRAQSGMGHPDRSRVIVFEGAFHGRTLAMLAATGNAKYLQGFGPKVDGFDRVSFGNMNAVRDAIGPQTGGILVEPVQGEGGVRPAPDGFLRDLRVACDEFGLLLGVDEVQCGMGRTGRLFAHEWAGIRPDLLSAAKGIAGGFPMGAILATSAVIAHLAPGAHGSTFGGNPLACAAGMAVLDVVLTPGFLDQVSARGESLTRGLQDLVRTWPTVFAGVRGTGLMLGLQCVVPNSDFVAACLAERLLVVGAGDNVVRLLPPLIVDDAVCDTAIGMLHRAAARCGVPARQEVA